MMSMPVKKIMVLAGLFFAAAGSFTPLQAASVGTTTADILKINQGTRPAGMAGVYTALGDDAYSVDYNPAGLALVKASQLVILHLDSLADIQYEFMTFATSWGGNNTLAVNTTYRHSPPIDNQVPDQQIANTDDFLGSVSYARKFSDSIRAGATVKLLQSTLGPYSASAVAGDLGIQIDNLPFGFVAGLAVQNIGTGMTFNPTSSADPLPMFIRVGLGGHWKIDGVKDMKVGVEVFKPSDQDIKLETGAEYWLFPGLFAIRGGHRLEGIGQATYNVFQGFTLGCSLAKSFDGDDFGLDIAYNPAEFISPTNPVSTVETTFSFALNFKFNQFHIF